MSFHRRSGIIPLSSLSLAESLVSREVRFEQHNCSSGSVGPASAKGAVITSYFTTKVVMVDDDDDDYGDAIFLLARVHFDTLVPSLPAWC